MATPTKDVLLDRGADLLLERGYAGTGLDAVLRAAGAAKGSFYHHFESKEDYALQVIDRWFARESDRLAVALAAERADGRTRLRGYFEQLADAYEAAAWRHGCLLGTLGAETAVIHPAIRDHLRGCFDAWRQAIAAAVETARADGAVAEMPPADLAAFLLDAWEGAALQAKVHGDRAPLERFLTAFDLLLATR